MSEPIYDYDPAKALDGLRLLPCSWRTPWMPALPPISREQLYKSLCERGKQTLKTMLLVMKALGVDLQECMPSDASRAHLQADR